MKPTTETVAVDLLTLLQLTEHIPEQQEQALMEFRIRGIDEIIDKLKKTLEKEDKTALNNHLKLCPGIDCLVSHLESEFPAFQEVLAAYLPKLHKKIA